MLNSVPVAYFFKSFYAGGGLGENGFRYKKVFLENLPIPMVDNEGENEIEKLVELILEDYSNREHTINLLNQKIYNLYNLDFQ